ncbi:MAG: hypothetical protein H7201_01010 [Candidatus Saccharibacteria bacterium]|nr:hypothetical protein [Microbacteriaceae bacterium]
MLLIRGKNPRSGTSSLTADLTFFEASIVVDVPDLSSSSQGAPWALSGGSTAWKPLGHQARSDEGSLAGVCAVEC